jgi:dTDP-glucose 4,6-dehydratase
VLTYGDFNENTKFLQISTDEVYRSDTEYFIKTLPIDPHSPYFSSKAGVDLMVKTYFDIYKMSVNS